MFGHHLLFCTKYPLVFNKKKINFKKIFAKKARLITQKYLLFLVRAMPSKIIFFKSICHKSVDLRRNLKHLKFR